MTDFFTLGLYQLENLISARPSFRFLDVRLQPQLVSSVRVQNVLSHATVVPASEVQNHLKRLQANPGDPLVLVCEDGRLSNGLATELETAGFKQVYIVEGGLDGLLREAALSG